MQLAQLWNAFIAFMLVLTGLWLISVEAGGFTGDFWLTRKTLVMGTGVLAFGLMSVAVILAARPVWFETALGGLDKLPPPQMARNFRLRLRLRSSALDPADGSVMDQISRPL